MQCKRRDRRILSRYGESTLRNLKKVASAGPFKAGVAKVEITPSPGLYLLGSGEAIAKSTHDPLYACVLALEVGRTRVALVTVDLCRVFQAPLIERLRKRVRDSRGVSCLLIAATHTHSGPIIPLNEEYALKGMAAWQTGAVRKIAKAIEEAYDKAVVAKLGTGYGVAHIGHNRRRMNPDGTVTMMWSNPTKIPTSPVDPTVAVLRVDTQDGKPLAILVNYACHPVVIMGNLRQYSADFPGVMTKIVEQEFENQPLCLFLQGAAGDIDTYYTNVPLECDPVKWMNWTGERLGSVAARVAKGIGTEAFVEPSLKFAEDLLSFRWRWAPGKFEEAMRKANPQKLLEFYMPQVKRELQLPVATILINRRIAITSMPGEPFVEFQMNWRARCPAEDSFFVGYANGFFSYLPTIRAAAEGGHGGGFWTRVEPGAGERMVDHAIVKVYEMLEKLTPAPVPVKE